MFPSRGLRKKWINGLKKRKEAPFIPAAIASPLSVNLSENSLKKKKKKDSAVYHCLHKHDLQGRVIRRRSYLLPQHKSERQMNAEQQLDEPCDLMKFPHMNATYTYIYTQYTVCFRAMQGLIPHSRL